MFLGHFGAGFAAKKIDKTASLGTYFMAAQWIDLIWPVFLLFGIERAVINPGVSEVTPLEFVYYPFSHSLFGVIVWAVVFGSVYFMIKKNFKTALVLGLLVISHWLLDLLVHIPDLPIFPGESVKVGLGLWNSFAITLLLEALIFGLGVFLYYRVTKAKNKIGTYSLIGLTIFLIGIYVSNLIGPPPPSVEAIAYAGNAQWLFVLWGYWIDRNREYYDR